MNATTSQAFGTAVGADYSVSTYTSAGFALAGGGTNFAASGIASGTRRPGIFRHPYKSAK
jgi:hypothetical protein